MRTRSDHFHISILCCKYIFRFLSTFLDSLLFSVLVSKNPHHTIFSSPTIWKWTKQRETNRPELYEYHSYIYMCALFREHQHRAQREKSTTEWFYEASIQRRSCVRMWAIRSVWNLEISSNLCHRIDNIWEVWGIQATSFTLIGSIVTTVQPIG